MSLHLRDSLEGRDVAGRQDMARRAASYLEAPGSSEAERRAAEEILRALAEDVVNEVRMALAEAVSHSRFLPKDIARRIAHDIDPIACPFLHATEIFTEPEWCELVSTISYAARRAVAGRPRVAARLVEALAERGEQEVVETLARNDGAEIHTETAGRLLECAAMPDAVAAALLDRADIPADILPDLVLRVSDAFRRRLAESHELEDFTSPLIAEAQSRAMIAMVERARHPKRLSLVKALDKRGRLDGLLLLEALRSGHFGFFTISLAYLVGEPQGIVESKLKHGGLSDLKSLLERAGIASSLHEFFWRALQLQHNASPHDGSPCY